jgi:hypothetical protein
MHAPVLLLLLVLFQILFFILLFLSSASRLSTRQSQIVSPGTELKVIWPLGAFCFTILLWRVRERGQLEFRHEVQVLLDQGQGVACGASDVLLGHSTVATQLDSPEALNIVFD